MYKVTKTFTHAQGLSTCFRQWRATHSHCQYLHGYALEVAITFTSDVLDDRGWVIDFGDMGNIKGALEQTFDHKTVVAADDPLIEVFREMDSAGLIDMVVINDVGCEHFARHIYKFTRELLPAGSFVNVESVTVREHGGNAATYEP